ncbi:hypothetical protein V498_06540 [Pseudogymnoascus sp. VKM F-4517 (FW-2822)]|nr:hypothetical protein V498_06540 [Pseudogymnoascus sp. VKM F-4517 (FW-2822)]
MFYGEQYTDSGLLPGAVQAKTGLGIPSCIGMYRTDERFGRDGALKLLVSKFESLSSSTRGGFSTSSNCREKANREPYGVGKLKEKGRRTVVVLKTIMKGPHEEESPRSSSETHLGEAEGGPGFFVKNHDNIDSNSQTSPVVRSRKEGRKSQGGLEVKREAGDSQTLPFEANGDKKVGTEAGLKLKTERSGDRKESLVQMRIRLLEQSQKTQQNHQPTIPKDSKVIRSEGCNNELTNTATGSESDGLRSGSKERDGAELHEPHPHLASRHLKRLGLSIPATDSIAMSVTSPKVGFEMHAPRSAKQKLETAAESESEAQQEPIEYPAFKVPFYRSETRNRKEASPKSLAPIIRERIKMFESTRDDTNVNLAALDAPSTRFRGQIDDKGKAESEPGGKICGGTKEVVGEKHAKAGWSSPTTEQLNKTMSAFSRCLAERTRSRTGCMVDGKYVSAFAYRRRTKETSSSTSWATTMATRQSEPAGLNVNLIKQASPRPTNRTKGIISCHIPQPRSEQQSNASRLPISSSSTSESGPNTLSDWSCDSHEASPLLPAAQLVPSPSVYTRTQCCAPADALPQARNLRVSDIIAMASRREQFADARRMTQEHTETDDVGTADSECSDDEDGTLIVQSVARLREPKPLRIAEVSSLEKICRLGRSRGDLE